MQINNNQTPKALPVETKWWTTPVVIVATCGLLALLSWNVYFIRSNDVKWWQWALFSIEWTWLIFGIRRVRQRERLVIEVFGVFWRIYSSGLRYRIPIIMQEVDRVSLKEQPINLFIENPVIDFRKGGTAKLVDPKLWIKIKEENNGMTKIEKALWLRRRIYDLVYATEDWKEAGREDVETALRSIFGRLEADEVFDQVQQGNWWDNIKTEFPHVIHTLENWGLDATRVTITDFDWDPEVKKARQEVYDAQRKDDAAKYISDANAKEMAGFHAAMVETLEKKGYERAEANEIAERYVVFQKGTESGQLVRFEGEGGGLGVEIAKIITQVEMMKKALNREGEPEDPKT